MRLVRTIARPMIAGVFVVAGLEVLADPEPRAKVAKPVVDWVASVVPFAPTDPVDAVRLNAAVHLGAGVLLAGGVLSRLAALALAAANPIPEEHRHPWWPARRGLRLMEHTGGAAGCS